ncbi:hypothetical protein FKP32DRAFT_1610209 [Trametes sanguinea]|nr:hypothetical protein FKP32DRAFT_1610209 [Trametes sanguinea]
MVDVVGQRIIEPYADLESYDPPLLAEPTTGLTIRRIKSAGLRIVTESETVSTDPSRTRSSTLNLPEYRQSYLAVRTPDTSHTFGLPNPSMLPSDYSHSHASPSTSSPSASPEILTARRLSRYSRAESALHSAVEVSSTEVSPQELQIRILEQATAILSEQARDAQACAERLRACLADQELSPEELKALQRERWLEEHKSQARTDETHQARALLTQLSSPVSAHADNTNSGSALSASPPVMTRHEANLARFLQYSPTRVTFPGPRAGGSPSPLSPALAYRRETISQVRPMRLRPSAMELALRSPLELRMHGRSRSLDGGGHSRNNSDTTDSDATVISRGSSGQTTVAATSVHESKSPSPLLSVTEDEGTATIEKAGLLRSRDELLAQLGDVPLPDYAVDLLHELVSSTIDVSLNEMSPIDEEVSPVFRRSSESSFELVTRPTLELVPQSTIAQRLCSPPPVDVPSQSSTPFPSTSPENSPRRRTIRPRSSFRNSLHVPMPKFSSLRLSSTPSLVPVAESPIRPQSSLGSESSSTVRASSVRRRNGSGDSGSTDHRRFSVVSFRRLSEYDGGEGGGVLARFRKRFSSLGQ